MSGSIITTGERIIPGHCFQSKEAYLLYLRHLFAYTSVKEYLSENSAVVEIGCGEGYGTNYLSPYVKYIIGLDVDENIIHYASEKYGSENCFFTLYDGSKIPDDDHTYDVVISFQVIEHVQDDTGYLAEIHRILKIGGRCILTTPNRTSRVKLNKKPWNRFHLREYSPDELENLLKTIFSEVHIWGIRGNEEIQNIEQARIKRAQRFATLDPFNLRKFLPPAYETIIVTWLKRCFRPKNETRDFLSHYSLNDYALVQDDIAQSLDLLAVSQKT
jgi:SAM-dependent methyltransferase